MNREARKKDKQYAKELLEREQEIRDWIGGTDFLSDKTKEKMYAAIDMLRTKGSAYSFGQTIDNTYYDFMIGDGDELLVPTMSIESWDEWLNQIGLAAIMEEIMTCEREGHYMNTEVMEFDGDVIITDPCYVVKNLDTSTRPKYADVCPYDREEDCPDYSSWNGSLAWKKYRKIYADLVKEWNHTYISDWKLSDQGDNMEVLGINNYLVHRTLVGDWSATTYDADTKETLGTFAADAGLVGVFSLEEILKYNPDFDYDKWVITRVKDFKGTVQIVVKGNPGNQYAEVVGRGVNKITGKPFNFVGGIYEGQE